MVTRQQSKTMLKGNSFWSISYALSSLRNYPVRNAGIAFVLAIGVAIPTTVFVWSATGTRIAVTDYFAHNTYQLTLSPQTGESYYSSNLDDAIVSLSKTELVDCIHLVPSTVGILHTDSATPPKEYTMYGTNYRDGIKDMRILIVNNDILSNWSVAFEWDGKFNLQSGEVLVSEQFVEYASQVHNISIKVGSVIDVIMLKYGSRSTTPTSLNLLGPEEYNNLRVVGIYKSTGARSLIEKSFISIPRKNWDPMSLSSEPVLGLADSIMLLQNDVGQNVFDEVLNRGFFTPVAFLRASQKSLMAAGVASIGDNLIAFKDQIEEAYPKITVKGLSEIWQLDATISTYLQSQILTIIVFPVLIMSLILTVFTSETSISRRKGEISALRAKGASFNQVFATFMWESLFLGISGFLVGIFLSILMAPLLGATVALFTFDPAIYLLYLTNLTFPPLALIIAGAIAMYLPASYLLHVARRIDVSEVGQPTTQLAIDETTDDVSIWKYVLGLTLVLAVLLILPEIVQPAGPFAIGEIITATLILFAASYLGSRTMRQITARLSGETTFLLGEKALYLSRSLRKRKGQFIPLLVILTLTLTTTTMMIIQSSSFETTLDNEISYAIGADIRIECDSFPLGFNKTILQQPGVFRVTPVLETWAQVGSNNFFLEGVNAIEYSKIGYFSPESFLTGPHTTVLSELAATPNGIIISNYYSQLWNRTVGDMISVTMGTATAQRTLTLKIVGIMQSAPGFGVAAPQWTTRPSFASQLGFQIVGEGFALVNLDFLYENAFLDTANLFLVDTVSFANISESISSIAQFGEMDIYSSHTFNVKKQSYAIFLFLSGIEGLTVIAFLLCAAMGFSAIALFLGSAVLERQTEYAVFRALGGTKRQVISMVFGEFAGTIITSIAVSLLLGLIFGYSMSLLTFGISPFSPILPEILSFPFTIMVVIVASESLVMIISCYLPARRAGSVDPAVVLRNL